MLGESPQVSVAVAWNPATGYEWKGARLGVPRGRGREAQMKREKRSKRKDGGVHRWGT